jgi:curved DNA-binding protein CbpA
MLAPNSGKNFSEDPADARARAVLGVGASANEGEIRRAYRAKMAKAHPDQGGSEAEAALISAARDRLLRAKR